MTPEGSPVEVRWSERARRDLREIGDFIAKDKPDAARRWVARLMDSAAHLATFPSSGRLVPEVKRDDVREMIIDSYRIVYQIREEGVVILTVFEGHRIMNTIPELNKR